MLVVNKPCFSPYHLVFVIQMQLSFVNFKYLLEKEITLFSFTFIYSAQKYTHVQIHDDLQEIKGQ